MDFWQNIYQLRLIRRKLKLLGGSKECIADRAEWNGFDRQTNLKTAETKSGILCEIYGMSDRLATSPGGRGRGGGWLCIDTGEGAQLDSGAGRAVVAGDKWPSSHHHDLCGNLSDALGGHHPDQPGHGVLGHHLDHPGRGVLGHHLLLSTIPRSYFILHCTILIYCSILDFKM